MWLVLGGTLLVGWSVLVGAGLAAATVVRSTLLRRVLFVYLTISGLAGSYMVFPGPGSLWAMAPLSGSELPRSVLVFMLGAVMWPFIVPSLLLCRNAGSC